MSPESLRFTFEYLRSQFEAVAETGYEVVTCGQYAGGRRTSPGGLLLVNRVDIDVSPTRAQRIGALFADLGMPATFFVRLHAKEYNPFDFESYRALRWLRDHGFELGYHSEVVDQAFIWGEDPAACLERDLRVLGDMFEIQVEGVASHGGMTGLNNLDFWKTHRPEEFGLRYEAYDPSERFGLFEASTYVSDSLWTRWKTYVQGVVAPDDEGDIADHARAHTALLYTLIHPETYYDRHPYE